MYRSRSLPIQAHNIIALHNSNATQNHQASLSGAASPLNLKGLFDNYFSPTKHIINPVLRNLII